MSNFSYDDFAVLVRKFNPEMLSSESLKSLRIVPLSTAPSMADAIKGTNLTGLDNELNLPREKNGTFVESNVTVQHDSAGYCRLVGHIEAVKPQGGQEGQEGQGVPVTTAKAFVLYHTVTDSSDGTPKQEVIAVASLKEGFEIGDVCYPSFTITKVNNYQSVAFNPNAFATVEDLKNINGLDGLHIAFDTASGDLKLLDKDGKVLDQANLHMDADTIIADGEEGYKYVKTDIQQDIHAEKDFMPAGKTAQNDVSAQSYVPKTSCFLVEVDGNYASYQDALAGAQNALADAQKALAEAQAAKPQVPEAVESAQARVASAQAAVNLLTGEAIRKGNDAAVKGIRVYTDGVNSRTHADYALSDNATYHLITDASDARSGKFLVVQNGGISAGDGKSLIEVYSPDAFVWTVGKNVGDGSGDTFAEQMNAAAKSMGFHVGDDIPLGTNIPDLLSTMSGGSATSPETGFDAEKYMHEGTDSDYIDELVDAQRNLAKDELKEWNKQHPALIRDYLNGTRISSDGVDIRNGKIEIGNGIQNDGEDNVKRYVIETDIYKGDRRDAGLQIGVMDSVKSNNGPVPIQTDILTINAEDYISGAPTCLALLKCSKSGNPATVSASLLEGGRITANFDASGAEDKGVFTLTITDNRANNGFGYAPRIVEIIPVYKSGADATEAVPAQRSISAIATAEPDKLNNDKSTLSIRCSQVIDWAQSIDLGGTAEGMELYLIVKVY